MEVQMKRKKSKKSKKTKRNSKNRHHIIPSSRHGKEGENITLICQTCHSLYHKNFSNMTPVEIINFLVEYYWKGQWKWVIRALIEKDNTRET
tara:strand:+ start:242 stop:517 length:276 start_codon:yes stop_codon:yes gene_type:complete